MDIFLALSMLFMLFTFLCGFMGIKNKEHPVGIVIVFTVGIIQFIVLMNFIVN